MFPIIRPRASFYPNSLGKPLRWYTCDNPAGTGVTPANGAAVATLVGMSYGINATQGTGANQPVYETNGIGTRGVLNFVSNDFLTMANTLSLTSEFTMFFVNNSDTTNATRVLLGTGTNLTTNKVGMVATNTLLVRIVSGGSASTTMTYATGNNILTLQRNSDNKIDAAFNGAVFTRLFADGAQAGTCIWNTIGIDDTTNSGDWNGDIGEIIIYDWALSAAERLQVERYLSQRWSITV